MEMQIDNASFGKIFRLAEEIEGFIRKENKDSGTGGFTLATTVTFPSGNEYEISRISIYTEDDPPEGIIFNIRRYRKKLAERGWSDVEHNTYCKAIVRLLNGHLTVSCEGYLADPAERFRDLNLGDGVSGVVFVLETLRNHLLKN